MGYLQTEMGPFVIERRAARRTRATCAASLQTLTDESVGYLWDLSETGARVSVASPPQPGENALLKWGTEKVMCRVVWTDRDMCGLSFDRPIASEVVAASARLIGIVEQPIAALDNIPIGRKRSERGASTVQEGAGRPDLLATRLRPDSRD
ncbi:MAG: PilZ domain-containing protein [Croceibacterium sp.]